MFPLNHFFSFLEVFITTQSTPTPNFKYTSRLNEINEIMHIHCISTEMLCRATMSSYKASRNQTLWSEPTHPHTWRKQDWGCSLVFSDNWQNARNLPSKKGIFAAWLYYCWGLEQISPLHSCMPIASAPLDECRQGCSSFASNPFTVLSQKVTSPAPLYCDRLHSVLRWWDSLQQGQCVPYGCTSLQGCTLENAQNKIS